MKKKILACLMALTLVLTTGCSKASTDEEEITTGEDITTEEDVSVQVEHINKINITINPEANIITDDEGIVTEIECVNEDAETAYGDLDLVGLSAEEAAELMTEAAAENGFLVDGKPVTVSLVDTTQEGQDTLDELTEVKEGVIKELNDQEFTDSPVQADVDMENTEEGTCDLCNGSGVTVCDGCNGTTYADGLCWTVCGKCSGAGKTLCTLCNGAGSITCDNCGGSGHDDSEEDGVCFSCKGSGKMTCNRCSSSSESGYQVCEDCNGAGKLDGLQCYRCGGSLWMVCNRCNGTGKTG